MKNNFDGDNLFAEKMQKMYGIDWGDKNEKINIGASFYEKNPKLLKKLEASAKKLKRGKNEKNIKIPNECFAECGLASYLAGAKVFEKQKKIKKRGKNGNDN